MVVRQPLGPVAEKICRLAGDGVPKRESGSAVAGETAPTVKEDIETHNLREWSDVNVQDRGGT